MVATRSNSASKEKELAQHQQQEEEEAVAKAAGKKHKDTEEAVNSDDVQPEKKKPKPATSRKGNKKKPKPTTVAAPGKGKKTPKPTTVATLGKGEKKAEEIVERNEAGKPETSRRATVEETEDPDMKRKKKKKHDEDVVMMDAAVAVSEARDRKVEDLPILEKGLVYFFLRGKVNVEHPESMDEVKRSYMVLRPLPQGAGLVDGKVEDTGKNRLLSIPKKRLPASGYEKFLTFVEEPQASLQELREQHLRGSTYQTKTVGERTDFPAQHVGEGVYAITKSDNERQSHFAYMLTIPDEPNELQEDFGLRKKGSFVVSVRNPQAPALPNAAIPHPAEYPKEMLEEFNGLRWGPVQLKHLDYKNSEILFIGEKGIPEEGNHEGTADELNLLEQEDEKRVAHLNGDERVFADLELNRKEFLGVQTTWG